MATKAMKKKVQAKPAASKRAEPVVESLRDVIRAGIGAFALLQKEGGKLLGEGGKLFEKFVAEGGRFENRTRDLAEDTVEDIREGVETTVGSVRKQAADRLDKLESAVGFSVTDTLNRLGIPTTGDLSEVATRVQMMSRQVSENWRGLDKVIEKQVKALLDRLGVPVAEDLEKLSESLRQVANEAAENLGKLEGAFEKRVSGVLDGMEIPSADDFKKISAGLRAIPGQFTDQWGKLENELEGRITGILDGLGVPTREEIDRLSASVAELAKNIAALDKAPPTGKALTASKSVPRKKVAKKAVTRV